MGRQNAVNNKGIMSGVSFPMGCAYNAIPTGFLLCDGAAISRTAYANLFAKIGVLHGVGDGSTTFNLPNQIDRFTQGVANATTDAGATGGATSKTTNAAGGGASPGSDVNQNRRQGMNTTHSYADIRPKYLECVPVISI